MSTIITANNKTQTLASWFWLQEIGATSYNQMPATVTDTAIFSTSTETTEASVLDQITVASSTISAINHTFAMTAGTLDLPTVARAIYGATFKNNAVFLGSNELVAKRYRFWSVSTTKNENDMYIVSFFRLVGFDGVTSMTLSRASNIELPMNLQLFSDPDLDGEEAFGVMMFESPYNSPDKIEIPSFSGGGGLALAIQLTFPTQDDTDVTRTVVSQVIFNKPIAAGGNLNIKLPGLNEPNLDGEKLEFKTVEHIAQLGSTNTSLIHDGDAYPVNSFVGAKVTILFESNLVDTRDITAYNPATKTFTISVGTVDSSPESKEFNILAGYVKFNLTNSLAATTGYQIITGGARDSSGISTAFDAQTFTTGS